MPRLLITLLSVVLGAAATPTPVVDPVAPPPRTAVVASIARLPRIDPAEIARAQTIAPMDYEVQAEVALNARLTRLRVRTTLTITAPAGGSESLVLGVTARRYRAYRDVAVTVDGVAHAFTYNGPRSMALRLDLRDAPWVEGSVHQVVVEGVISPGASTDRQGLLRRFGSGGATVISAGDLLPLPMERPRTAVFADPLSAPSARAIEVTITSARELPTSAIIASGERLEEPSGGRGRRWVYRIAPARSFALIIAPSYGSSETTFELPDTDGQSQRFLLSAHGPSAAARADDLTIAEGALRDLWSRFGPGPHHALKVVSIPGVSFAHEYPGLVTVGLRFNSIDRQHVVRHEVIHQWWHTIVATDQGRDPWMDETLTEWAAQRLEGATATTRGTNCTKPIDGPSYRMDGYYRSFFGANQYWDCVYLRGPRLLFAIGDALGHERLEDCLANYVQAHRFASPAPAVLVAVLRTCAVSDEEASEVERALARYLSPATIAE